MPSSSLADEAVFQLRADGDRGSSRATGFVVKDARFGDDYQLITALHALFPGGEQATFLEIFAPSGARRVINDPVFTAWPEHDLAAIPLESSIVAALGGSPLVVASSNPTVNEAVQVKLPTSDL